MKSLKLYLAFFFIYVGCLQFGSLRPLFLSMITGLGLVALGDVVFGKEQA